MDFAKAIAAEKNRIHSAITDLSKEKSEIDNKISKLQLELDAITAYENTKSGKPARKTRGTSVRAQVLALIKSKSCTRAEVISALGYQNEKGKQQTVSNTLAVLKKKGDISLKDGTYSAK